MHFRFRLRTILVFTAYYHWPTDGILGNSRAIARTKLGSTGVSVTLLGPDAKNHYRYFVSDAAGARIDRLLGPVNVSHATEPQVSDDGAGRFRITWGSGIAAAYTLIDTKNRRVLADTNQANHAESF